MKRTGSIGSRVGPAVINTVLPATEKRSLKLSRSCTGPIGPYSDARDGSSKSSLEGLKSKRPSDLKNDLKKAAGNEYLKGNVKKVSERGRTSSGVTNFDKLVKAIGNASEIH